MLKALALLTMVIDHIGFLFFPDQDWMRAIGRLTMPIFGYAIARGFYYTSNSNKYIARMAVLAVVSQAPFTLLFSQYSELQVFGESYWVPVLNMIVPWTLALILLRMPSLAIAPIVVALLYIPMDYTSLIALLPIAIYHLWFKTKKPLWALLASVSVLSIVALVTAPFQWFALFAIPLIYALERWDNKVKLNRWFFYFFYPVHMLIFLGIIALL